MTKSTETHDIPSAAAVKQGGCLLAPARYRHPGDVIRLIIAGLVLAGALAVTAVTHVTYAGASAAAVTAVVPSALAGRVLAGLVQGLFAGAAVAAVVVTLRYRRFRLLAGLAGGAVLAGAVLSGVVYLAGGERPRALAAGTGSWPWLTGASLAGPALLAAAVACAVAAAPWLTRPWRRTAWIMLWLAAVARLITATASPVQVVLAFAAGVTVGAGVLVLFGVPDRRIGAAEIAAALGSAGLPVARVNPAPVEAKGSRPFTAVAEGGEPLFIKVLGSDQRDADLLYRGYRFLRLRGVGDTRPAASLIQAAEHQALVEVMAERAGVTVPAVRQVVKSPGFVPPAAGRPADPRRRWRTRRPCRGRRRAPPLTAPSPASRSRSRCAAGRRPARRRHRWGSCPQEPASTAAGVDVHRTGAPLRHSSASRARGNYSLLPWHTLPPRGGRSAKPRVCGGVGIRRLCSRPGGPSLPSRSGSVPARPVLGTFVCNAMTGPDGGAAVERPARTRNRADCPQMFGGCHATRGRPGGICCRGGEQ
jgi:hypothetical protein